MADGGPEWHFFREHLHVTYQNSHLLVPSALPECNQTSALEMSGLCFESQSSESFIGPYEATK